ncbi:hypothetical protein GOODEAATRI_012117 [Goodea atripinnis]|uniref:C2H2-type domain-containing protein n=1 Tax=Goodea atripinnis TaxID=208336 RepID=A0ABV0NL24_9TELE
MEPACDRAGDVNTDEEPKEDRAAEQTPVTSTTGTLRRALRERGAGRPRSGVSSSPVEVNGGASSAQTSGRVLRDRSTRAVPAWLKDSKSDEEEDEPSPDSSATKRRKVPGSRRRKGLDSAVQVEAGEGLTGVSLQGTACVFMAVPHSPWHKQMFHGFQPPHPQPQLFFPNDPQPRIMPDPQLAGLPGALPSLCVRPNLKWRFQLTREITSVSSVPGPSRAPTIWLRTMPPCFDRCEICGFTCRQKASLNWHMKKHDADATYQFSCSICGKKFEKKDCVVAHKAKSHPEVLIAEALAANAGSLITTPSSLLELPGNQAAIQAEMTGMDLSHVGQDSQVDQLGQDVHHGGHMTQQVSPQVVLLGQDQSLHTMQVPVTIALTPIDPPSPADHQQQTHLQLQMPVQFVQTGQQLQQPQIQQLTLHSSSVVTQHQPHLQTMQPYSSHQQSQGQTQILQMTFQPVSQSQTHVQQIPILANPQQLQTMQTATPSPPLLSTSQPESQDPSSANGNAFILDNPVLSSSCPPCSSLGQTEAVGESSTVWEQTGQGEVQAEGSERHVLQVLI